ncbi:ABC transporter ATP-binding protein [Acetivibrio clariflavus]|uniref:ABC transporter ATP-binding protein n=1 Tax=Acetivibrio clariflavus TaxID=288965 RepID=UPI0004807C95|nr:ABC transporter ATP-binding protein [Acetivibrio clariflavus]
MEKVIEIKELTKIYKNGRGIQNLSLDIYKGDIFGFLGPNGSGKTTAMKIMTGLMKADSGTVKLLGYNIVDEYEKAMERVGCIIETAESYPYLTAYENLKLFSRYYKNIDDNRINEVLELTGLLRYQNEKAKNFSLGMKQRLGLSAAILSKPDLVILDEPLNGLDVEGMIEIRKLIKRLAETEKTTFFISSHLIHDVELTCTRIGILYEGKLLNVDYMQNILSNYATLENYFISEVDKNGRI